MKAQQTIQMLLLTLLPLLALPLAVLAEAAAGDGKSHSQLLTEATVLLTSGKYGDAITALDSAIALEPDHYLTYYRRATALLSLGRSASALADLEKLLELNPSFANAWLQKGKIYAKEGDLLKAKDATDKFLKNASASTKQREKDEGHKLKSDITRAIEQQATLQKAHSGANAAVEKILQKSKNRSEVGKQMAADPRIQAHSTTCVEAATAMLEVSVNHLDARRFRADCNLWKNSLEDAMADWSRTVNLSPSTTLHLRLSALSYFVFGEKEAGRLHLKNCLHSDPDNKACAQAHRKIKGYERSFKKLQNFKEGGTWRPVLSVLKGGKVGGKTIREEITDYIQNDLSQPVADGEEPVIPQVVSDAVERSELLFSLLKDQCKAHVELDEITKALPLCEQVLLREPDNIDAHVAKGEIAMKAEEYEEAVREFTAAFQKGGNQDRNIHAKLTKAQKRLKLQNTKDYYKVLGVARDADARTIKKAYRTLARKNHPDKGGSQKKMAEINEAFGVLGNDELRQRYDLGDDPNDPAGQAGQGGYGNPFTYSGGGGHHFAQMVSSELDSPLESRLTPLSGFQFQQQGGFGGGGGSQQQFRFHFGG